MASRNLIVEVIGASGLKDTELIGKSDPYVTVTVGKETRKTKPAKDQAESPAWNEVLPSLPVSETDSELLVRVLNDDTMGRDEEMGRVVIPLSLVGRWSDPFPMELKGKLHGEIKLSLSFEGEAHHEEHHGLSEKVGAMFMGEKKEHDDEGHESGGGLKEKLEDKVEGLKEKKHRKKKHHRGSGDEGSGDGGSGSSESESEKDD